MREPDRRHSQGTDPICGRVQVCLPASPVDEEVEEEEEEMEAEEKDEGEEEEEEEEEEEAIQAPPANDLPWTKMQRKLK